jgi:hypothetical protein
MKKKLTAFDPLENYTQKLRVLSEKYGATVHELLESTENDRGEERWTAFNLVIYYRSHLKQPLGFTEAMIAGYTSLHADVQNGGFHQYFSNSAGDYWQHVLQILKDGVDESGEKRFQTLLSVFPSSHPSLNRDERNKQLDEIRLRGEDQMWDWFELHSKEFYEESYPTDEVLWQALRNRPNELYIPSF